MNQLQHALDNLPASHYLHGKPLTSLKLNKVVEVARYYKRHNQDALHAAFMAYARGLEMDFGPEWKQRDNGFTIGASHHLKQRYADSMRMYYGISVEG